MDKILVDYVNEIEAMREKYELSSYEILALQLLAGIKVLDMDYDDFLKEIIEKRNQK